MKSTLAACALVFLGSSSAASAAEQKPLRFTNVATSQKHGRKLTGRFLQITGASCARLWKRLALLSIRARTDNIRTDIHPDPFYKTYSSTETGSFCHRGKGAAGYYGAETSDCDAPLTLVNATFAWIAENLADSIDFVIWTGDSARHDNDEEIPRTEEQVLGQNRMLVNKFKEVFGSDGGDRRSPSAFKIPIVPTFGNNDILPHNIMVKGPNRWTRNYEDVWHDIVPEAQRHAFDRGGWFFVEVIPNKLAVISLNTM